jgi:hypothetical protein
LCPKRVLEIQYVKINTVTGDEHGVGRHVALPEQNIKTSLFATSGLFQKSVQGTSKVDVIKGGHTYKQYQLKFSLQVWLSSVAVYCNVSNEEPIMKHCIL